MERNITFYFSGTGNSLKVAQDIAAETQNTKVIPMGKAYSLEGGAVAAFTATILLFAMLERKKVVFNNRYILSSLRL
ncbi:hypothetical protein LQZ18_08265 [Lachnospiraceae bacterium ZAX-1]